MIISHITYIFALLATRLMKPELVNMVVTMRNPCISNDVLAYVECAAAKYTVIRGGGFAGHIQVNVSEDKGLWSGNAIYTLPNAHSGGLNTIDAEVTVEDCTAHNIPMV